VRTKDSIAKCLGSTVPTSEDCCELSQVLVAGAGHHLYLYASCTLRLDLFSSRLFPISGPLSHIKIRPLGTWALGGHPYHLGLEAAMSSSISSNKRSLKRLLNIKINIKDFSLSFINSFILSYFYFDTLNKSSKTKIYIKRLLKKQMRCR
jgi:hypothetical protein